MENKMKIRVVLALFACVLVLTSCATTTDTKTVPDPLITPVTEETFDKVLKNTEGKALVLFYNDQFWQSQDMMKRFLYFSEKFKNYASFYDFVWDPKKDGSRYGIDLLPTIGLYENGILIDRLRGVPGDKVDRLSFNDDIELWMLKNVVGLTAGKYVGDFRYRFNNSNTLHIGNY